jgi:hypothetical protein
MSNVLKLVEVTNELVIVEVNPDLTPLEKARAPWAPNARYVSVTRGKDHTMTFIKEDSSSWSIVWGYSGSTMISDSLRETRNRVVNFIEQECGIPLELKSDKIVAATIYFNANFGKWQINLTDEKGYSGNVWFMNADFEDMVTKHAVKYVGKCAWEEAIAPTGITIWKALL